MDQRLVSNYQLIDLFIRNSAVGELSDFGNEVVMNFGAYAIKQVQVGFRMSVGCERQVTEGKRVRSGSRFENEW